MLIDTMTIQQALQKEIEESKRWIECTQEDGTYKRDLQRVELINWVLGIKNLVTKKSDKCIMCNHSGELDEFDEVRSYCLICETYE